MTQGAGGVRLRHRLHVGVRVVGTVLLHLFDGILLRTAARTTLQAAGPVALLVRLDRIGDVVLWLPAAQRLAEAWRERGYRVVAVVRTECAALVQGLAGVDDVLSVDCSRFRLAPAYRARVLMAVRRVGAELAAEPTPSRVPSLGDAILRFSGAGRRVGWVGDASRVTPLEKRLGDRAYTELVPNPPGEESVLRINEAFLDRMAVPAVPMERSPLPRRPLAGVEVSAPLYVLVPGAGERHRQWPAERFARLAALIHRETGWSGVICGSGSDRETAGRIMTEARVPLIDLTGRTALAQLAEVIAGSALVVSNETGTVHIAASLRVPSVCITGGGHYGRFVPYPASRLLDHAPPQVVHHSMPCFGCNWHCHFRPTSDGCAPCIDGVTVERAADAVRATLKTSAPQLQPA